MNTNRAAAIPNKKSVGIRSNRTNEQAQDTDGGQSVSFSMEQFLSDVPLLHTWDEGKTWNSGGFSAHALSQLHDLLKERFDSGFAAIETGAGASTIVMLMSGARELLSIAPDEGLFTRIRSFCEEKSVDVSPLTSSAAFSELALPQIAMSAIEKDAWVDVAFIDGGHGWPTVFVDFCYMHAMLRNGGLLIVDDTQLYSVKELVRFLLADWRFRLLRNISGPKTLVFEKRTDLRFLPDFGWQPYIMSRTNVDSAGGRAHLFD